MRFLIFLSCLFFMYPGAILASDSYVDEIRKHIELIDLKTTFKISHDMTLKNIATAKVNLMSNHGDVAEDVVGGYIESATNAAQELYKWESVEGEFIQAFKSTYTFDEIKNINEWLASKYGSTYISKQQVFFKENMRILGDIGTLFQSEMAPLNQKLSLDLQSLSKK